MTITTFRFYYYARTVKRERSLTGSHWGFATWFKQRLKPIREQLRGPEAKGVNIVNVGLYEIAEHAWYRDEWRQRGNTFNFSFVCDLRPLEKRPAIENIQKLMLFGANVVKTAPWPQVNALEAPLAEPLSPEDIQALLPHLQWPRPPGVPIY